MGIPSPTLASPASRRLHAPITPEFLSPDPLHEYEGEEAAKKCEDWQETKKPEKLVSYLSTSAEVLKLNV